MDETRNSLFEGIEQNKLISKKHKKFCTTLYYIEHVVILASTITGFISILIYW